MVTLRALFATAAIVSLTGTSSAADIGDSALPQDWSGKYVGAQVGYSFGDFDLTVGTLSDTDGIDGIIGGLHAGYLWQRDGLVIGFEGDVYGLDARGRLQGMPGNFAELNHNIGTSARLRAGVAFDRALIYATGGVAMGDVEFTTSNATGSDSRNDWYVGYTVGGGVEFAMTEAISARIEYRYTDLGSETFGSSIFPRDSFDAGLDYHMVQGGLSLHF